MPTIAEQRARIAELASRMIAKNPGNAGAIMQQLKGAGLDISGNPIGGQGGGAFPLPNVPPAGGSYTGLMSGDQLGPLAKYAGRTPAPPGGLTADESAIPFNGTGGDPNSLRSMADRGDPSQAPGFRSRLADARMMQGSGTPGLGLAIAGTNPTAQVQGQLPGNFMSPGNLPRPRPFESPIAARPGGPLGGFPAAPPPQNMVRPAGPPGGFPAAPPSMAQGPMPGSETVGPPSPLASRFGDQSQLAGGAFSGSIPRLPQPRPFESMIAGRPMPPGGPGSLPAAPLLAGQPFTGSPGMASRFGDQSQLAGGAFSGGPPPPMAGGPTPQQLAAAKDQVQQIAALRPPSPQQPVAPISSLMPLETTPTSTTPNPLQRAPLDLAAGAGAPKLPLGSTSLPFATSAPFGSVGQRTADVLGPLPPGAGPGLPGRVAQTPLIGVPPAAGTVPSPGTVTSQPLGPPSPLSSIPPASMQALSAYTGNEAPIVGQAAPGVPQVTGSMPGYKAPDLSRISPKEQEKRARERGFGSLENIRRDRVARTAGVVGGGLLGLFSGGPGGAVTLGTAGYRFGDNAARGIANLRRTLSGRGLKVDDDGNILDKAGNIIGNASNMLGRAGSGMGGIFGGGGSSVSGSGGGGGGWGGIGGWGGGSSYTGGQYGGNAGGNINQGIGQRFGQR